MAVGTPKVGFAREVANRIVFIVDGSGFEEKTMEQSFKAPGHWSTKVLQSKIR
jgi:ABC-type polar amino acid transport system ATPase subunit